MDGAGGKLRDSSQQRLFLLLASLNCDGERLYTARHGRKPEIFFFFYFHS
jgi:hypothetical protein